MQRHTLLAAAASLLTSFAAAQSCSTLTVTGTGAPGTSVTFAVDGTAAGAFAILAVSDAAGTTTLNFGSIGTLVLGVNSPFIPLPLGMTDASGDVSRTVNVPNGNIPGVDLVGQGVTVEVAFTGGLSLTFCTSNVATFHLGS